MFLKTENDAARQPVFCFWKKISLRDVFKNRKRRRKTTGFLFLEKKYRCAMFLKTENDAAGKQRRFLFCIKNRRGIKISFSYLGYSIAYRTIQVVIKL